MCTHNIFFIHPSAEGLLYWSHHLSIVNSAAVNMDVQVSLLKTLQTDLPALPLLVELNQRTQSQYFLETLS